MRKKNDVKPELLKPLLAIRSAIADVEAKIAKIASIDELLPNTHGSDDLDNALAALSENMSEASALIDTAIAAFVAEQHG